MSDDFQFNPPEMDLSFLNVDDGVDFTAPSVENSLSEIPLETLDPVPNTEIKEEVVEEKTVSNTKEEVTQSSIEEEIYIAPPNNQTTVENVTSQVENTQAPIEEIQPLTEETIAEVEKDSVIIENTETSENLNIQDIPDIPMEFDTNFDIPEMENISVETSLPEEIEQTTAVEEKNEPVPEIKEEVIQEEAQQEPEIKEVPSAPEIETATEEISQIDAQDKVANAIKEKMSEMKQADTEETVQTTEETISEETISAEIPSFDIPVDNMTFNSEEAVTEEEDVTIQNSPVDKSEIFKSATDKIKDMIKTEKTNTENLIKEAELSK